MPGEKLSFEDADSIFVQDDVLSTDWIPDDLPERTDELNTIHKRLEPAVRDQSPKDMFIYGKTGQGKTAAVDVKINELKQFAERDDDLNINRVWVSCNGLDKSYHVAAHLLGELQGPGGNVPRGYDIGTLYKKIYQELNRIGGTVIIVLDEIDNIGTDDGILYELPRAHSNGHITDDVKLSIIGISNDFDFRERLSSQVKDSLYDTEIHFPPYDANQLQDILRRRATKALKDGVIENGVVELCAAYAAQENGSARQAIKYLGTAAEIADDDGKELVTTDHVTEAEKIVEQEFIERGMASLTIHDHLALCAVAHLEATGDTPARTRDIYERYTKCANATDHDSYVLRRLRDRLTDLKLHSIIDGWKVNNGRGAGRYSQYELSVPLEQVITVLKETTRFDDVADSIQANAEKNGILS
ncbi:Cdc6/Cdc18 family protein [Haladaptatus pallidirubidus]|uniref:ORC1-type DNA replication protein n=1 Tax=Haladaptatus pallidirubidus TaxID=1008152 RepID=A0AAV3UPU9_9EURY|nr:AAA family ATPase [Haladaptatus pallidirubidus]